MHLPTPEDQLFKVLMRLLNYALQTHSWEMLYSLGNSIRFLFRAYLHTLTQRKQQHQRMHVNLHTAKCISVYAHTKRNQILEKYRLTVQRGLEVSSLVTTFLRICISEPI